MTRLCLLSASTLLVDGGADLARHGSGSYLLSIRSSGSISMLTSPADVPSLQQKSIVRSRSYRFFVQPPASEISRDKGPDGVDSSSNNTAERFG